MSVKLLTEHHLEFLSLKETAQARLSLHVSKCHIGGNHMSRLKCLIIAVKTIIHIVRNSKTSMANSMDPDQTALIGAVCSGSTLFGLLLDHW